MTPALPQLPSDIAKTRLLVVDDEAYIRTSLQRALNLMGYVVDCAASGDEALTLLEQQPYDLMVLDMRMPGMDGLEVIEHAHRIRPGLLIIILTGHATLDSAIAAVRSQEVVDYLLKPASVHQVAAAIAGAFQKFAARLEREHLVDTIRWAIGELQQGRRPGAATGSQPGISEPVLSVYPLTLDRRKRQVVSQSNPALTCELTEGEAAVLAALMSRANEVLTDGELAQAIWGHSISKEEARGPIRSYIFRLRQKLEAEPAKPRLIQTIRGQGYLFNSTTENR